MESCGGAGAGEGGRAKGLGERLRETLWATLHGPSCFAVVRSLSQRGYESFVKHPG